MTDDAKDGAQPLAPALTAAPRVLDLNALLPHVWRRLSRKARLRLSPLAFALAFGAYAPVAGAATMDAIRPEPDLPRESAPLEAREMPDSELAWMVDWVERNSA